MPSKVRPRPLRTSPPSLDGSWTGRRYAAIMESDRAENTFLVRTWREAGDDAMGADWRGSVEHLGSKQRRYFRDFTDLCSFILTHQLAGQTRKP